MTRPPLRRDDIIEPELSYRIVGLLYDVHNALGSGYRERIYQRALASALEKESMRFQEQVVADVFFRGVRVGRCFLDFLIEGRVIVELKQGPSFSKRHFEQITEYLKAHRIALAILAHFTSDKMITRRVLNPDFVKQNS